MGCFPSPSPSSSSSSSSPSFSLFSQQKIRRGWINDNLFSKWGNYLKKKKNFFIVSALIFNYLVVGKIYLLSYFTFSSFTRSPVPSHHSIVSFYYFSLFSYFFFFWDFLRRFFFIVFYKLYIENNWKFKI